ncbi:hypothetical protein Leryth_013891 [Lithospermum erythrorhizon]|uniref:Late embryogenesis abundant protein LEA-2 subgroup domain-containing protein n=1 Tax=Lithospermum erythrorhizon TaxID=34254 RepID=A0AAV3Q9Q8_LITER|nr:hypothetical protein Leryth_013891 [Lithospermum erythrorhizon]
MPITTRQSQNAPTRRLSIGKIIAIIFLALIFLVGLAFLIAWLTIRPKRLVYSIENASIQNYNLANNGHLKSDFMFTIRAYNPNGKVSIYYDKIEAKAYYDEEMIGFNTIQPFYQRTRNVTHMALNLPAKDVALSEVAARDMKMEKIRGRIDLEIKIKAKVRFKVGKLKSRHRTLRITCGPLKVPFSMNKNFDNTRCDVDL